MEVLHVVLLLPAGCLARFYKINVREQVFNDFTSETLSNIFCMNITYDLLGYMFVKTIIWRRFLCFKPHLIVLSLARSGHQPQCCLRS